MSKNKNKNKVLNQPEMPFYCKECGKCATDKEAYDNLKICHNTGYTHDVKCLKKNLIVYGV